MSQPSGDGLTKRRAGPSSPPSSTSALAQTPLLTTAKNLETRVEKTLTHLLGWDDLAPWRRDNVYIRTGYRPDSNSYRGSFASLGYLHNESVNIWSHLLGALFFLAAGAALAVQLCREVVAPRYERATAADVAAFACFFAGAVACLGMSAAYHALSNHSPAVNRWGNKLDYSGIVFLIVGSYVPALWYGLFCEKRLMKVYMSVIVFLGCGCGVVSWLEHFRTPAWRPFRALMFVAFGSSGAVPVAHGLRLYGPAELEARMSLSWLLAHGGMYVVGAFLYAARWPERSFPQRFDIWGSSHQIFHLFVVLAASTHLVGMSKAFDFHHSHQGATCPLT